MQKQFGLLRTSAAIVFLTAILTGISTHAMPPQKSTAPQLMELAKSNSPQLRDAITATFDAKDLKEGKAFVGQGADSSSPPNLPANPRSSSTTPLAPRCVRSQAPTSGTRPPVSNGLAPRTPFITSSLTKNSAGATTSPSIRRTPTSIPDVPAGKLSEKLTHTSKIYDGMKSDYWIYVPAQYDPKTPAALLVVQDGEGYTDREGKNRTLNVMDNLIAQKKIPVMIVVFINPGDISSSPGTPTYNFVEAYGKKWNRTLKDSMRSTLYDTVSDRYPRFLRDEILADVSANTTSAKTPTAAPSPASPPAASALSTPHGSSPINSARVISWIGSFSAIQWKEDPSNPDGGQDYPDKILREPKRNIRVWLQDGSEDLDLRYGNWPLANLRMANALKAAGYDFHLSFGRGTHNSAHGAAEFPAEMTWLWRDYDPSKTSQTFEQDPGEKTRPPFRVTITNRQDAQ